MNQTIFTKEQLDAYLALPSVASLPEEEKKKKLEEMVNAVFAKVAERISYVLTEEDEEQIDQINAAETKEGTALQYFLKSKVPHLGDIVKEELEAYKALQK